ncbi:DNA integrity scanning protein DisA [Caloramator mitchellensis]|uniref:Diadenylate cyclase n=1 Tax=Caloramator mitchellensis TaxID=908809 RepID=A0A0R3JVU5_CALMK|nr:diadenylate cyclase CdaA [Caloramator mitchellensis]KRQ87178.1 DNA integrity scanning protein DisA [Caloramator mitchellensis]
MNGFYGLIDLIKNITLRNVIDIIIVAYILYEFYILIKETRAEQLLKGLIFIIAVMKLSDWLGLVTLYWIIKNTLTVGVIALIIIFQPELRKALEHLGRSRFLTKRFFETDEEIKRVVDEITIAVSNMSHSKTGSLIIIEQETGLNDFVSNGVKIDGIVSSELLENIFFENSPWHDGAVIIRKDRILAAGCVLPLTEQEINKELGTRHRAAIGVTESSDAIAIVVSEETGTISISVNGRLTRGYTVERLKNVLTKILVHNMFSDSTMIKKVKTWLGKTNKK